MWIKICGNTNLEDALFAAHAGADALGFVFAPSPRQISVDAASKITRDLPPEVGKYGVFVDAGLEEIVAAVTHCGLTGVQIHQGHRVDQVDASPDASLPARLRRHFAESLPTLDIVAALNYKDPAAFEQQLIAWGQAGGLVDAVLVDSFSSRAAGGTGSRFDWSQASHSFARFAPRQRLIAAGGLAPDNVHEAIALLQPWGVDVVSGVESSKGKKDPQRVLEFIQAAQQAGKELVHAVEQ